MTYLGKQGIITPLPKPGTDINNIANWRPISLLSTNYKIATTSGANIIKQFYRT